MTDSITCRTEIQHTKSYNRWLNTVLKGNQTQFSIFNLKKLNLLNFKTF